MSIAGDLIRGHTDTIILARLMLRDSYGYEINKTVTQLSGGKLELKEATLYTAFRRLEEAGLGLLLGRRGQRRPAAVLRHYSPRAGRPEPPAGGVGRNQGNHGQTTGGGEILMRDKLKTYIDYLFAGLPRPQPRRRPKRNSAKHPGQIR